MSTSPTFFMFDNSADRPVYDDVTLASYISERPRASALQQIVGTQPILSL